jgi:hypothetical protein
MMPQLHAEHERESCMPEPDKTLGQAIARLEAHGGYGWLLDGPDVVLSSEITKNLNTMGIPVKSNSVTLWLGELPSAQDFGRLGRGASREDVIKMLADRFVKRAVNG